MIDCKDTGQANMSEKTPNVDHTRLDKIETVGEGHSSIVAPRKNFNTLSTLSLAATLMATWEGLLATMGSGLVSGGPTSLLYGFILAFIGNLATAMSLSEPASMYPGAGGQYQFISRLASSRHKALTTFITGWIALLGWISLNASTPYLAANLIQGLIAVSNPNFESSRWLTTVIYTAIVLFAFSVNQWGSRILHLIENLMMALHLGFFVTILIAAAVIPPDRNSADFVFTYFQNMTGWENDGIAWCLGMLTSAYILVGYDAASHISDELKDPKTEVPHAMISCVVINGIMGFAVLIAVLFGMGSLDEALSTNTGFPIIQIFLHMTRGNVAATCAMTCTIIMSAIMAAVGVMASASRILWAFARDDGPPAARWLSQISERSRVPSHSLIVVTVVLILLGLLNIASTAAVNAVLSLTVVALNLSYLLPVVAMLYRRIRTPELLVWGPWRLSKAVGYGCNIVSICWITFVTTFLLLPAARPVTAVNMNYACVVVGALITFASIDWISRGKRKFRGALTHE